MNIAFWKMHGAGNDFVLVDDRVRTFPASDTAWLANICARRTGVGCDGIVLIQPSETADFKMRFFNPDGGEAEMCGNAARCAARLAREIGAAPNRMSIQTVAGVVRAEMAGHDVRLRMTDPVDWRLDRTLDVKGRKLAYSFVNTGVPHVIVETDDLAGCDALALGAAIRYHPEFKPAGTNANFIAITGPDALSIRTCERGVEAETLACGTGIVAAAITAARRGRVKPPVRVAAASGDALIVDFKLTASSAADVTLFGPAVHVFQGALQYQPDQRRGGFSGHVA
ncbi:MAG: diaminopimelate epimerase [Verrucomicrobiota bacterium]|nr:diaminopimelate epimerase [Verrucomicrobiota bacterium]